MSPNSSTPLTPAKCAGTWTSISFTLHRRSSSLNDDRFHRAETHPRLAHQHRSADAARTRQQPRQRPRRMDYEAGALACMRHAQRRVVTVAIDSFVFRHPIRIGDLVILDAEVTYAGRTSMEAEVQVRAENPITGKQIHTNTAYLVYVALDDGGQPTSVPPLTAETEEEKRKMREAQERQARRLAGLK